MNAKGCVEYEDQLWQLNKGELMRTKRVEVDVEELYRTGSAIKVKDSEGREHWLPLSKVAILEQEFTSGLMKLSIPEWLAIERGLV